ncbi:hypothetical protein Tco_0635828 [Tanacetum coccineum]
MKDLVESDQDKNKENIGDDEEEEVKDEFVKTSFNGSDDEDETKITNKAKGDEDEEMDYTTSQLYDDVDIRLNEPVDNDKGVTALEKEVTELKKDPLQTQVIAFVDDHLDARLGATRDEFMNCLSSFITARVTDQVKIHLPQILPKEESSQPQSSYEAAATLIEFELKKIMINKMDKSESYLAAPEHRECYKGLNKFYDLDKTIFSNYSKVKSVQSKEPELEVRDSNMPQDQEENPGNDDEEPKEKVASKCDWFTKPTKPQEPIDPNWNVVKTPQQEQNQSWLMTLASSVEKPLMTFDELMSTPIDFSAFIMNGLKINNLTQETLLGPAFILLKATRSNYAKLEYDFEKCYKALSKKLDWENSEGSDYPFDLTKPIPLVMSINHQKEPVDYFFSNDLKYLHDVYSTKRILAVTQVEVMRKHGYGYLQEIMVRRTDNDLYRFKEGDFLRLRINDIKDMLLFFVQNRLTNLSGDDVSDFVIALRMFTRSLVIQKRVEDLQLGVESY